jgi:hypothetical protein
VCRVCGASQELSASALVGWNAHRPIRNKGRRTQIAADAGSAGVGHCGIESKQADRNHRGVRK